MSLGGSIARKPRSIQGRRWGERGTSGVSPGEQWTDTSGKSPVPARRIVVSFRHAVAANRDRQDHGYVRCGPHRPRGEGGQSAADALFTPSTPSCTGWPGQLARAAGSRRSAPRRCCTRRIWTSPAASGAVFPDRGRFMAYAARVMRGLIIDYARSRQAQKRGGGVRDHLARHRRGRRPRRRRRSWPASATALDELADGRPAARRRSST